MHVIGNSFLFFRKNYNPYNRNNNSIKEVIYMKNLFIGYFIGFGANALVDLIFEKIKHKNEAEWAIKYIDMIDRLIDNPNLSDCEYVDLMIIKSHFKDKLHNKTK